MRRWYNPRALFVVLAAFLVAVAIGAMTQVSGVAAACPPGDTSGSCSVLAVDVTVSFPPCPPGSPVCPPAVVTIRKDANHPYALTIDVPAPTSPDAGTTPPTGRHPTPVRGYPGTRAAPLDAGWIPDAGRDGQPVYTVTAKAKPAAATPVASIGAGDMVSIQMNRLGVFSFRVATPAGVQLTNWANNVKVARPSGYSAFETLTKLGWRSDDPYRMHTPGLHKWVR